MKTIVITGASSGIGRALAVRAARAGYAVYAVGRDRDALSALASQIEGEQGFVETDAVDISVPEKARDVAVRALARFGSIDVLVNNAGFVSAGPLVEQSDAEMQRQFGTHVLGPLALVRESRDALRAAHGHVFMLGSGVARIPVGGLGAYPPAKAALRSATAILRRELAADGIAVTYVDPGAVDTPFMPRAGMPGAPAHLRVSPEDVARKILIAVATRPREVNAVEWQTIGVRLAETFPNITEFVLSQAPGLVGAGPSPAHGVGASTSPGVDAGTLPSVESGGDPDDVTPLPVSRTSIVTAELDASHTNVAAADSGSESTASFPTSETSAAPALDSDKAAAAAESEAESEAENATIAEAAAQMPPGLEPGAPEFIDAPELPPSSFDAVLEPHRRRMEKLNLPERFVRELLVEGAVLDTSEVAMRWAGMPNKNERAVTEEVLEALAEAGFLERTGPQTYRVIRTP